MSDIKPIRGHGFDPIKSNFDVSAAEGPEIGYLPKSSGIRDAEGQLTERQLKDFRALTERLTGKRLEVVAPSVVQLFDKNEDCRLMAASIIARGVDE